ncbi:hypothetical protein GJW-30_1_01079 [Variibacter gotjawalensis]|uniref:DUF5681 domain-containing protein n=1 Tax=Variibacter gotjawalensis TaxID=1333996 RepID=A0A0S3PRN5_9BRAD|nr:DUF5681 domain-containing protein [Variibacter gotjawalensis]NIK48859.1 hypothetical protein [Variibacter gotjawalensis]RZS50717.1 hypothetical protein EV661_3186 [Variibacter gotjawalensis]BAT58553.1 hypothetical protein GJW-30_1_01079 [Variibacter gotjawalensis]
MSEASNRTRFKPGQSGNPTGRPKGALGFAAIVKKLLHGKITITENGRRKKISRAEALAHSIIKKAFSGDMKALAFLANFQERHDPPDHPSEKVPVVEEDLKIIAGFLKRMGGEGGKQ